MTYHFHAALPGGLCSCFLVHSPKAQTDTYAGVRYTIWIVPQDILEYPQSGGILSLPVKDPRLARCSDGSTDTRAGSFYLADEGENICRLKGEYLFERLQSVVRTTRAEQ